MAQCSECEASGGKCTQCDPGLYVVSGGDACSACWCRTPALVPAVTKGKASLPGAAPRYPSDEQGEDSMPGVCAATCDRDASYVCDAVNGTCACAADLADVFGGCTPCHNVSA